ncbi:MAG: phenylalanine--tRNA ligase subunit beta [Myxococcota bacterium]
MKTSWNWLKHWVDLDGLDPREIADALTMAGLESEGVEFIGQGLERVVVARIESLKPHPDADKLVVCAVDTGEQELRQIVCGAKNMKVGDYVPAALPGATLPGADFTIGERKMRGVLSQGMLAAADELGRDDGVDGLWILPHGLDVGVPVFEALGLEDAVLELGLTPNRPDALSHYGVAREIAALEDRTLVHRPEEESAAAWELGETAVEELVSLTIEDVHGCPRYALAVLEGVEVGPSPAWLRDALVSVGLRSINNVVDVTNYVLMDVGQPLHAFDLDKLGDGRIVVRRAKAGESIVGIDHKTYGLTDQDLVIANGSNPVAIAGVMGGAQTEVDEGTTRILIECAYFDPTTVRRGAKRHKLHTDSSHRFERGIDPGATMLNLKRAVDLMLRAMPEGSGARVAKGALFEEAQAPEPRVVMLEDGFAERVLGVEVSREQAHQALVSLGMEVVQGEGGLEVTVPTWRPDIERPIDLVEELARVIGYDDIPTTMPARLMGASHRRREDPRHDPTVVGAAMLAARRRARRVFGEHGVREAINYSFMGTKDLEALGARDWAPMRPAHRVGNPMNSGQAYLRTTLWGGLMENLRTNLAKRREDVALFEFGRVYLADGERDTLSVVLTGRISEHWSNQRAWDFYDLKGLVEALGVDANVAGARWSVPDELVPTLHPGVQAEWTLGGKRLAWVGQVHPRIAQREEFQAPVLLAEIDAEAVLGLPARARFYARRSRYPAVTRDFALLQERHATFAELEGAISGLAERESWFGQLLEDVRLFDVYEGERIEQGKRSVALQVVLRASDRTLSEEDIAKATRALVDEITEQTGAQLRE